tara:strand:- start:955 stop:1074 length:120 start_codon:yes stop_codon:yes gene_type:complete
MLAIAQLHAGMSKGFTKTCIATPTPAVVAAVHDIIILTN